MNGQLIRDYKGADCTLGRLTFGALTLFTLEKPWVPDPAGAWGHPYTSCLPAGLFSLGLHNTPKFPRHFALVNEALGIYNESIPPRMAGRTACLIHTGNWVIDVLGCIILGLDRKLVKGEWMLLDSRAAYTEFQKAVPWQIGHSLFIEYSAGVVQAV